MAASTHGWGGEAGHDFGGEHELKEVDPLSDEHLDIDGEVVRFPMLFLMLIFRPAKKTICEVSVSLFPSINTVYSCQPGY